jgi:two-component system, OmpR family, phosphate regulon sensor histidine kinase PhoR
MFLSIRWRIAIPYMLLILVGMFLLSVYLSNFLRRVHMDNLQDRLTSQAWLISDILSASPDWMDDPSYLDEQARNWANLLHARITITDDNGNILGESHEDRITMDNHLDRPEISTALAGMVGSSLRFSRTVGYTMVYVATPIQNGARILGTVRVAIPLQQVEADLALLRRTLLGVSLVSASVAMLLATFIAAGTTKNLRKLTQAAHQLAQGDLAIPPITDYQQDEVGQLANVFSRMANQLKGQIDDLHAESSKLSAVLEQMTDGVLIVDNQGRIQLVNPAAGRMFNLQQEEMIGSSLPQTLRHYRLVELWKISQETGETQEISLELPHSKIYLQGVAIPLGQALQGNTMLLFQDLTRLRRLETIRRDFISNISHEIRTPLASMKALTETLRVGALEDPPAAAHFLDLMESEVDALTQIVSELLELSRIESGQVLLHFKSTPPNEILNSVLNRFHIQAERAGLSIQISLPDDLPQVLADPPRIEQVLVNILHNAIKFTPSGGKISVSVYAEGSGDESEVIIQVSDTGVGIPQEDLPRIFERFYKADRARSGGGTGLGLAIAKHLVESHGGRIWVDSREGRGSSFFFSLPVFTSANRSI